MVPDRLRWADIDERLQPALPVSSSQDFDRWIRSVDRDTMERVDEGRRDELVYYVLQSRTFSGRPPIEPAASARAWADGGRVRIPDDVSARIRDFLTNAPPNGRGQQLHRLLPAKDAEEWTASEYRRAMDFLYRKEVESEEFEGAERRAFVASLYTTRGHSTDTKVESSFGVWAGVGYLSEMDRNFRVQRALVVGPGLDFSPRAELREEHDPQSHQPYVLMDSLLQRGMAGPMISVECVDVNEAVARYITDFPLHPRLDLRFEPDSPEHRSFWKPLGKGIGGVRANGVTRKLTVREHLAERVTARVANILTERVAGSDTMDLAVATNVLLYFDREELALALNNVAKTLRPGGYLLHNDGRGDAEELGRLAGLETVHARAVRLPGKATYDVVVIQRKRS